MCSGEGTDLCGHPIGTFQLIEGSDTVVGPSTATYFASEMVGRVADRAVQIHGGAGYSRGVAVERFHRDARVSRLYEGTCQISK